MKAVSLDSQSHLAGTPKPRALDRFAERLVRRHLAALTDGRLTVVDGAQRDSYGSGDGFGGGNELYVYADGSDQLILHNYFNSTRDVDISTTGAA